MNMEVLQAINEYLHTFSIPVVLIRLLLATICGGVIGFFRSMKKRGAGFKTHILVCLGATLIMLTGPAPPALLPISSGSAASPAPPALLLISSGFAASPAPPALLLISSGFPVSFAPPALLLISSGFPVSFASPI